MRRLSTFEIPVVDEAARRIRMSWLLAVAIAAVPNAICAGGDQLSYIGLHSICGGVRVV